MRSSSLRRAIWSCREYQRSENFVSSESAKYDAFLAALDAGVPDIHVEGDGRTHLVRTFRGAEVLTSAWKLGSVVYAYVA